MNQYTYVIHSQSTVMPLNVVGKMTKFDVKKHGFNFANKWKNQRILINVPFVGQVDFGSTSYGLCGGMTVSALDTFYAKGERPDQSIAPGSGTTMRSYIYDRQQDTFKITGPNMVLKIISWIPRGISTRLGLTGLHVLTDRQVKRQIGPRIDKGDPVPLCLVRNDINDFRLDKIKKESFEENHQVLAIGYRLHSPSDKPKHWDVIIYDPNFPNEIHALHYHEDFRVQSRIVDRNSKEISATGPIYDGKNVGKSFRGFFRTAYRKKSPPWIES